MSSSEGNAHDVRVDVPGVTPQTRIDELTVDQLVHVLVQVHRQLPIQRGMPDPKVISDTIEQIRQLIESPDAAFRQTQAAILREAPKILGEGPWKPKDGGASLHAGSTRPATREVGGDES
jgi:hypothetical protein